MLENEWHLARTYFKHGAGALPSGRRVAEAWIKKAGITVLSRCSLGVGLDISSGARHIQHRPGIQILWSTQKPSRSFEYP
jgi:hypothetical protein